MDTLADYLVFILAHPPILLVIVILLLAITIRLLQHRIKGFLGELLIRFTLGFLPRREYKTLHNVKLYRKGRLMAQIDHVVVSVYGIFVIETKNYKGWIVGNEHARAWKQIIYKNTYTFYNPLKQNEGHVHALQAHLRDYPLLDYFPIVVFTGRARLKVNASFPVIHYYHLCRAIKYAKDRIISPSTRDEIYERLRHVNGERTPTIPKIRRERSAGVCPKCAGKLLSKQGKFGKFVGCTNFPSCRYTKMMDQSA